MTDSYLESKHIKGFMNYSKLLRFLNCIFAYNKTNLCASIQTLIIQLTI